MAEHDDVESVLESTAILSKKTNYETPPIIREISRNHKLNKGKKAVRFISKSSSIHQVSTLISVTQSQQKIMEVLSGTRRNEAPHPDGKPPGDSSPTQGPAPPHPSGYTQDELLLYNLISSSNFQRRKRAISIYQQQQGGGIIAS